MLPAEYLTHSKIFLCIHWHIVNAYDEDMPKSFKNGDEHDYEYAKFYSKFWLLCKISKKSALHGSV